MTAFLLKSMLDEKLTLDVIKGHANVNPKKLPNSYQ